MCDRTKMCEKEADEYEKKLIKQLPSYAFKYDEGEKYVKTRYMVEIEHKREIEFNRCLKKNIEDMEIDLNKYKSRYGGLY